MENKQSKKIGIYDNCCNSIVFNEIEEKSECLDVGCWTGNLGMKLINEKGCFVGGVDFNEEVLRVAKERGYREIYQVDLNKNPSDLKKVDKKYDYIICADVLEHTIKPEFILNLLKENLHDNGYIIISIPNVAFIQQRIFLLFGKFDYNPNGGIMDETHLKFFTKKYIFEIIRKNKFKIEKFYGYSLVKNKFFFLRILAKIWPELFAMQFLIKIKK